VLAVDMAHGLACLIRRMKLSKNAKTPRSVHGIGMSKYLIHVYDERANIKARYVVTDSELTTHLESIERDFPGCSVNIAPKQGQQK
jgi:hypothetical protein